MTKTHKDKETNEEVFLAVADPAEEVVLAVAEPKTPSSYVVTLPNGSRRAVKNIESIKSRYPASNLSIREVYDD